MDEMIIRQTQNVSSSLRFFAPATTLRAETDSNDSLPAKDCGPEKGL